MVRFGCKVLWIVCIALTILSYVSGCGGGAGTGSGDDGSTVGTLAGTTMDTESGIALAGVVIYLGDGKSRSTATSGSDGKYRITSITPGTYTVTTILSGYKNYSEDVTIEAGETTVLDMKLAKNETPFSSTGIQGQVINSDGEGIPDANVTLDYDVGTSAKEKAYKVIIDTTVTDENGYYAFTDINAGTYNIRATHPHYLPNSETVSVSEGETVSQDIVLEWKLVYNGHSESINGLWGTSASNVFAVGMLGTIKHYDGSSWEYLFSGVSDNLYDIWGTEDGKILIAVGENTVLRSTDGGDTWKLADVYSVWETYKCVWGTPDGKNIYMTNFSGEVWISRDQGATWGYRPIGSTLIYDIWGIEDGSKIFVADADDGKIYMSNDKGLNWNSIYDHDQALSSVSGSPDGSLIVAVGKYDSILVSTDGGDTWTEKPTGNSNLMLWCTWVSPGEDIFVGGVNLGSDSPLYHIYKSEDGGDSWTPCLDSACFALWGTADGKNVFDGGFMGEIQMSDDYGTLGSWDIQCQAETNQLEDILGFSSSEIYTGGLWGSALKGCGDTWKTINTGLDYNNIFGMSGTSGTSLWGATYLSGLYLFDGSTWTKYPTKYMGIEIFDFGLLSLADMWSTSDGSQLLAVGYDEGIFELNQSFILYVMPGVGWMPVYPGTDTDLRGIWGTADDQTVIVVGEEGTILKAENGDFTSWEAKESPAGNWLEDHDLYAVWGTPDGSVIYAVGENGSVIKSTDVGETWELVEDGLGAREFYSVWGTSADDVYVGGYEIYHYDGTSWTQMTTQTTTAGDTSVFQCKDIWGTSDGKEVYAVGVGGRIYYHTKNN